MVDKITKELKKYSPKEKNWVKVILKKIKEQDFLDLEIKKLKTKKRIYRVRKGNIRIIFRKFDNKIFIISVERRSDNTYKF